MHKLSLLVILLVCGQSICQVSNWEARRQLIEKDSLFWVGYNTCNLDLMAEFLSDDMEFYHDLGGVIRGIEGMKTSMRENICNDPSYTVRRDKVPGSMELFLLKQTDTVYGAIIAGEHTFFNKQAGGGESQSGIARYTNLWIMENGAWKMNRILSYDHH